MTTERLMKASDGVFQRLSPAEERKPLEWRRSFCPLNIKLKNIKIIKALNVHERAFNSEGTNDALNLMGISI